MSTFFLCAIYALAILAIALAFSLNMPVLDLLCTSGPHINPYYVIAAFGFALFMLIVSGWAPPGPSVAQ
jgi:hypothetical protein